MDISSQPFSPWIRLAHRGQTAAGRRGWLRRLRDHELIVQESGTAWIWWEPSGGSIDLPPGHLAIIPPGITHAYAGRDDGLHLAIHFDLQAQHGLVAPDMLEPLGQAVERRPLAAVPQTTVAGRDLPVVRRLDDPERWVQRWERLLQARLRPGDPGGRLQAIGILCGMLSDLLGEGAHEQQAGDARVTGLLSGLAGIPPPNAVAGLCRRCGMGETAFRRAFKQTTGELPHRYFERRRVERAIGLLIDTALPVAEVAARVGYDDPFHFSRVMRRVSGHPPSWYRRQRR